MDMSTLKEFITPENIEKGVNLITGAGVTKVLKSSKTFNNIWDITIGNRLDAWNQKSIFKNQQDVEKYKNECIDKISKIPEEKITDPKLSVIGPALESSKYYIEEEEIRNLFTELIASSMNSDYSNYVQHSFVEIIKQLSPLDAKIFKSLPNSSPIVDIISIEEERKTEFLDLYLGSSVCTWISNLFYSEKIIESNLNSIAIENLIRLGLVDISDLTFSNEDLYSYYYSAEIFQKLKKLHPNKEFDLNKKSLSLTNFGIAFKTVCCDSDK